MVSEDSDGYVHMDLGELRAQVREDIAAFTNLHMQFRLRAHREISRFLTLYAAHHPTYRVPRDINAADACSQYVIDCLRAVLEGGHHGPLLLYGLLFMDPSTGGLANFVWQLGLLYEDEEPVVSAATVNAARLCRQLLEDIMEREDIMAPIDAADRDARYDIYVACGGFTDIVNSI